MKGGSEPVDATFLLGPGIYFLGNTSEIVYVGRSDQVLRRIYWHRHVYLQAKKQKRLLLNGRMVKVIPFSKVQVLPCLPSDLIRLEKEWIVKLRPKYNTQLIPLEKFDISTLSLKIGGVTLDFGALHNTPVSGGVRRI